MLLLAGDDCEPSPRNYVGVLRSSDRGRNWSHLEAFDTRLPRSSRTSGQGPTELVVLEQQVLLFFATHAAVCSWAEHWRSWLLRGSPNARNWGKPEPMPGRLAHNCFIRSHIVTRDGRLIVPFQHYLRQPPDTPGTYAEDRPLCNPRNGVLISADAGATWQEYGNIRLNDDPRYFGWAEPSIVELTDGTIKMLIRADYLGGALYAAESCDGGRTWPDKAVRTNIPNPGSKATLHSLGGDCVALLHNPNPKHRSPLALWISFDGMQTWPYRRVLVAQSVDGPQGRLNYPEGFVSRDRQWLHLVFDDNRHQAVYMAAKLPPPELHS
jgi:predicted neuraminidase